MINTIKFRFGIASALIGAGAILISASLIDARQKGPTPKETACDNKLFTCWSKCYKKGVSKSTSQRCSDHCVETWSRCNGYPAKTQPPRPLPRRPSKTIEAGVKQ